MRSALASIAALALVSTAGARDTRLNLDGPYLYEADNGASELTVADVSGDGLLDIVTVNNNRSLMQFLVQQSGSGDPDEARFKERKITLNKTVRSVGAADVNGDGRIDLLLAGSPSELTVMFQTETQDFRTETFPDIRASQVALADLNGDGGLDLVTVEGQEISIYPSKARGLSLTARETFFAAQELANRPYFLDANGDGLLDMVYLYANQRNVIVVRPQSPQGTFPFEVPLETGVLRSADVFSPPGRRGGLATIHAQTNLLDVLTFQDRAERMAAGEKPRFAEPYSIAFDPEKSTRLREVAVADADGDGRSDLILNTGEPFLQVLSQTRSGALSLSDQPSLRGIERLIPMDENGAGALLLLSPEENAIGLVRLAGGLSGLSAPVLLSLAGKPLGVVPHPDAKDQVVVLSETGEDRYAVAVYTLNAAQGRLEKTRELLTELDFRDAPTGMKALDFDLDGSWDLMLSFEYDPTRVYTAPDDGEAESWKEAEASAFVFDPARLALTRFRVAENPETLWQLAEKFLRVYERLDSGAGKIRLQINAEENRSRFVDYALADVDASDGQELVILDAGASALLIYAVSQASDAANLLTRVDLKGGIFERVLALDLDGDGRDELVLLAKDRAVVYPSQPLLGDLVTVESAETDLEEGGFTGVATLAGEDSPVLLAAVENTEHLLVFFELDPYSSLKEFYRFKMFDSERSLGMRSRLTAPTEPRDLAFEDLNLDGKKDLVLLVHDKVAVYWNE
ncbi:MAG: VCBS repeat-containing protein [Sumerlaeia bacterium]